MELGGWWDNLAPDNLAPDNLAPGQFGTNITKTDNLAPDKLAPGQFGTKIIKRTIWQEQWLPPSCLLTLDLVVAARIEDTSSLVNKTV